MPTKHQRDVGRQLERLGYEHQPTERDGKQRAIYRHPSAGRVTVALTPGDHRDAANTLADARRKLRQADSNGTAFVDFLCRHHRVPKDGEKEIAVAMKPEVERWVLSGAAEGHMPANRERGHGPVIASARATGRLEPVVRGTRHRQAIWKVRGRDWLPTEAAVGAPTGEAPTAQLEQPAASTGRTQPALPLLERLDVPPANGNGNGHADHVPGVLEPAQLAGAWPDLTRLLHAGLAAELRDRDERLALTLDVLDALATSAQQLANAASDWCAQLEDVRQLLEQPVQPAPAEPVR